MALSKVTIKSIATDGTNYFVDVEVFNGDVTMQLMTPVFPVGTSASEIVTYITTIANNRPALTSDIAALVNTSVTGS